MSVTIPYPSLSAGAVVTASELNQNFSALANKFGTIDNNDVKSGANIDISKLSASYEHLVVPLIVTNNNETTAAANWTGGTTVMQAVPLYNDSMGDWTINDIRWVCTDCGGGTGQFRVKWAYYSAGALTSVTNVTPATTIANTAGADTANQGTCTLSVSSLAFDANPRMLILTAETDDATTLTAAYSFLCVSVHLKRQIST